MGVWTSEAFGFLPNGSGYSDWPGLEQVFEIRRCWQSKGEWREAVRYGVTSLPAPIARPERLLKLKRGHWTIENGLHSVKDVPWVRTKARSTVRMDPKSWQHYAIPSSVCSVTLAFPPSPLGCATTARILKLLWRFCLSLGENA
jgi:hypothetical protein